MLVPAFWWGSGPPNIWVRIGAFNLAMAIVLGGFVGLALRSFLLAAVAREESAAVNALRALKGVLFLALGAIYAILASPMLVWDHPARVLAAVTVILPPLVAGIRHAKGWSPGVPRVVKVLVSVFLTLVLFGLAIATLMRAGFITLKADRVPLVLEVTGETRAESNPAAPGDQSEGRRQPTAHHVILWLPDGTPGADVWVTGDRVGFTGRAVLFSRRLNALGVPNLYEFREIRGEASGAGGNGHHPLFSMPFPLTGPLAVPAWWQAIQIRILNGWQAAISGHSLWGIRKVENSSPFYPLVEPGGELVRRRFLLDLTLDGIATSRGSSPLE